MRRWNGWGDETHEFAVPEKARTTLSEWVGPGQPPAQVTLAQALAAVPKSRLTDVSFLSFDPEDRLRHARGQSLADWVALRFGKIGAWPDAVAYPDRAEDVRALLDWSKREAVRLMTWGGGTSVAGHINP